MKKVLLHIATPFAGIVTYMIVHIIAKLFFKLQEFLSHGAPIDYRTDSDSWICSLAAPAISIVAASLCTKYIAPSGKVWHYAGISLFCILCAIMYCNWYEAVGVVLGCIGGFSIIKEKDDDELRKDSNHTIIEVKQQEEPKQEEPKQDIVDEFALPDGVTIQLRRHDGFWSEIDDPTFLYTPTELENMGWTKVEK